MSAKSIEVFTVQGDDHTEHRIGANDEHPAVPDRESLEDIIEKYPERIADRVDWVADVHHCMARSDDDPDEATYTADPLYRNLFKQYRSAASMLRNGDFDKIGKKTLKQIHTALEYYDENVDSVDWEFVSQHANYFG